MVSDGPSDEDCSGSECECHIRTEDFYTNVRVCNFCGGEPLHIMTCDRCRSARYCNRECQKKDWSKHKPNCTRHRDTGTQSHFERTHSRILEWMAYQQITLDDIVTGATDGSLSRIVILRGTYFDIAPPPSRFWIAASCIHTREEVLVGNDEHGIHPRFRAQIASETEAARSGGWKSFLAIFQIHDPDDPDGRLHKISRLLRVYPPGSFGESDIETAWERLDMNTHGLNRMSARACFHSRHHGITYIWLWEGEGKEPISASDAVEKAKKKAGDPELPIDKCFRVYW